MRICSIDDCEKKHNSKGYCAMHYVRFWKYGSPNAVKRVRLKENGRSRHVLYRSYKMMLHRCYNTAALNYRNYGGRGIKVSDVWSGDVLTGFPAFVAHVESLEHCYEPGYSIDRIDNDGDYEPGNVKWSSRREQAGNRRVSNNVVGVRWHKGNRRWRAGFTVGKKTVEKEFKDYADAVAHRKKLEKEHKQGDNYDGTDNKSQR